MDCSCGQKLKRYVRDTPAQGEATTTYPVQVDDDTLPETEAEFRAWGVYAVDLADAEEYFKGKYRFVHDTRQPDGELYVVGLHGHN